MEEIFFKFHTPSFNLSPNEEVSYFLCMIFKKRKRPKKNLKLLPPTYLWTYLFSEKYDLNKKDDDLLMHTLEKQNQK